jgi:hypothetical protein
LGGGVVDVGESAVEFDDLFACFVEFVLFVVEFLEYLLVGGVVGL